MVVVPTSRLQTYLFNAMPFPILSLILYFHKNRVELTLTHATTLTVQPKVGNKTLSLPQQVFLDSLVEQGARINMQHIILGNRRRREDISHIAFVTLSRQETRVSFEPVETILEIIQMHFLPFQLLL